MVSITSLTNLEIFLNVSICHFTPDSHPARTCCLSSFSDVDLVSLGFTHPPPARLHAEFLLVVLTNPLSFTDLEIQSSK